MSSSPPLAHEDLLGLLKEEKYSDILLACQDFIRQKVDLYLRNFQHYHQYRGDFYQEVCIHILTRSLPSPAFQEACQNANTFKFYLAKTVRNILNTLLNREKNKAQKMIALEGILHHNQEEQVTESDKSPVFWDKSTRDEAEVKDLLHCLKAQLDRYLQYYEAAFPRIAHKLVLLLKLHARVNINAQDLYKCFPGMPPMDVHHLLATLGKPDSYRQMEDKLIYQIIHPYFQQFRQEKGSPAALQRWLNQHITGDKYSEGIVDKITIREPDVTYQVLDKRLFADFLFAYFQEKEVSVYTLQGKEAATTRAWASKWVSVLSRS